MVLEHAARCLPTVKAAVLIESALNQRRLSPADVDLLLRGVPERIARPLRRVRADAQSGTETTVRWWFESWNVPVRAQVQLLRDARVDMVVGRSWVIECDSRRFHDDPDRYREDRRRDLALTAHGFRVTRLTWEQVMLEGERTRALLQRILRQGAHRRERRG